MAGGERTIAKEQLTRLLAAALGEEKGDEIVTAAAHALGFAGQEFAPEEARAIFERVAKTEGLIGVVARFALSRGELDAVIHSTPSPAPCAPKAAEGPPLPAHGGAVDLVALLGPALGMEKARDATTIAAARLGLDAASLSRQDALRVLDELAREEGIVGVIARFAKARFLAGASR